MAVLYLLCGAAWILGSDLILGMFVREAEPLTRLQIYKGWAYVTVTGVLLYVLIAQLMGLLRRRERALANVIETANEGIAVLDDKNVMTTANRQLCALLNVDEHTLIGYPLLEHFDERSRDALADLLDRARGGWPGQVDICIRSKGGAERWALAAASSTNDRSKYVLVMLADITERKRAEEDLRRNLESQRRLLHELNHRVRNNLASLIAMIETAVPQTSSIEHFASSMAGRLQAMAAVHTLLSQSDWSPQRFDRVVKELTPPGVRDRLTLDGPEVRVPSSQVGALALVLHEMIVNSTKHGAMSVPGGTVRVTWSIEPTAADESTPADQSRVLTIDWTEQGGPPIESEPSPGYGTSLVEGLIEFDLQGSATLSYPSDGVHHRLRINLLQPAENTESSLAGTNA